MGRKICLFGLAILACLLLLGAIAQADNAYKLLKIQIPKGLNPDNALVIVGQYGNGLAYGEAEKIVKPNLFTQRISKDTTSVKVLIQYPGYKLIGMEILGKDISPEKPLIPKFEKLPTVQLKIKFTYSDGKPVANKKVTVTQPFPFMEYYNISDGGLMLRRNPRPVPTGYTDSSGLLSIRVPQILDDPILVKYEKNLCYYVRPELGDPERYETNLVPSGVPAQRSYKRPFNIKVVYQGRISGRIDEYFFTRYGIKAPRYTPVRKNYEPVYLYARGQKGHSGGVSITKADGGFPFTLNLPSDKYDLDVQYKNPAKGSKWKSISVKKGLVVGEREARHIIIQ